MLSPLHNIYRRSTWRPGKTFYLCVDHKKTFDCLPYRISWWLIRNSGVDKWIVSLVHCMSSNARSRVQVGDLLIEGMLKSEINGKDPATFLNYVDWYIKTCDREKIW